MSAMQPSLRNNQIQKALRIYSEAKFFGAISGFAGEAQRHNSQIFADFTESDLLREAAWVILCTGFSARIVRGVFDYISLCFCDWESAKSIVEAAPMCRATALSAFRNSAKIDAIIESAQFIDKTHFGVLKKQILLSPVQTLAGLPYIGPVTSLHLAKNLGLSVAKPDRHLVRLSKLTGFENAHRLCSTIASHTGDKVHVVDIVLWRYMTELRRNRSPIFSP